MNTITYERFGPYNVMEGSIDRELTKDEILHMAKIVYEESGPVGMGHFQPFGKKWGDEETAMFEDNWQNGNKNVRCHLDYVNGRQCKFVVWAPKEGKTTFKLGDKVSPERIIRRAFETQGIEVEMCEQVKA